MFGLEAPGICWGLFNSAQTAFETAPSLRHPGLTVGRNRQAVEQKLAYVDFLALLIEDEIARREQRKLVMRQRRAGINTQKTLESYDFTFNLGVNQAQIMDLATCRYLEEKVPVLIVGPCGTGKSRIAQALGHIAVRRGYDAVFSTHANTPGATRLGPSRGHLRAQTGGADQGGSAHHQRLRPQAHATRTGR
jgi:hypothetical protein